MTGREKTGIACRGECGFPGSGGHGFTDRGKTGCAGSRDFGFAGWLKQVLLHQQKIFPSGPNNSATVDALSHSCQRHPGGGLLRAGP
jgi:hypothetical protein